MAGISSKGMLALVLTLILVAGLSWAGMKHHGGEGVSRVKDGIKATLKLSPRMVDLLLVDATTGRTLTDAKVKAVIILPDGAKVEKDLIGMKMGDVFSYMNSLDTSRKGTYRFDIVTTIEGRKISFDFDHELK